MPTTSTPMLGRAVTCVLFSNSVCSGTSHTNGSTNANFPSGCTVTIGARGRGNDIACAMVSRRGWVCSIRKYEWQLVTTGSAAIATALTNPTKHRIGKRYHPNAATYRAKRP